MILILQTNSAYMLFYERKPISSRTEEELRIIDQDPPPKFNFELTKELGEVWTANYWWKNHWEIIFKQILRIQGNEVKVCNTSFHVTRHLHVYAHVYTYAFLFQWIWQDNTQFLQDNNIFEHTYFGWDILLTVWPKLLEIFQMNIHALYIHVFE